MAKTTEKDVKEALTDIYDNRHEKALNYAVNYAIAGRHMQGHELYVQVLYVLNNMSRWRGDLAKKTRETLKIFIQQTRDIRKGE